MHEEVTWYVMTSLGMCAEPSFWRYIGPMALAGVDVGLVHHWTNSDQLSGHVC